MRSASVFAILLVAAPIARAADVGVFPKKLVVVDKRAASGTAKVAFVARDPAISKGAGTDPADIGVRLVVDYAAAAGQLEVPGGASGWLFNDPARAKFVNRDAPLGPAQTGVALVKPGKVLTLKAKGLGETVLDLTGAGAPTGSVFVNYEVTNGGATNRHCAEFPPGTCTYTRIARDTGAKLVCRGGVAAASCVAAPPFCATYLDCAQEELCRASRCLEMAKLISLLPGVVAAVLAEPLCVPQTSSPAADLCYTNSGACTPGCALSVSVDMVDAQWVSSNTLRITVQSDLSSSVPIDPPLFASCTLDWAASDTLVDYDFAFAADGSIALTISTLDPGTITYSGCSIVTDLADIVSEFSNMALAQTALAIGPTLEAFLQP